MYLIKRNKIYHLFYKNEQGKLLSKSTKCRKKVDAHNFTMKFFNKPAIEETPTQLYTYDRFKTFYNDYASARFSKSYQAFVKIALDQFEIVIDSKIELPKITCLDVENFIMLKRKTVKERIVNGYLATLQGAFQRAVEYGMLKNNVFKVIKKLKPPQNFPLFLSKKEFEKLLLNEEDDKLKLLYRFGVYTGMRLGEIISLKWSAANFDKGVITVFNHEDFTTKSKRSRNIPIYKGLIEDLQKMKGKPDEYIFRRNGYQYTREFISRNFKAAVIRASLNGKYHFHTLRHTFASWLVQAGVSIYEVSKLLGYSDIKTTEIYAHLQENNFSDSVNLL
jgi:integrase